MRYKSCSHVFLLAALFVLIQSFTFAVEYRGRVEISGGVDPSRIHINIHEAPMSLIEGSWNVIDTASINRDGTFKVNYEPSSNTELEFVGPNILRKRFPFPTSPDKVFVFKLNTGTYANGKVTNDSGQPIADALLGPVTIIPNDESSTFASPIGPFFTKTNGDGEFKLEGLPYGFQYKVPIFAEGYKRISATMIQQQEAELKLQTGGSIASGYLKGELSADPRPDETIRVIGVLNGINIYTKSDSESNFQLTGLPKGEYQLTHQSDVFGYSPVSEVSLDGEGNLEGIVVSAYEGTNLFGTYVDRETAKPIANAFISVGDFSATTDDSGFFTINKFDGDFPLRFEVEHSDYQFLDRHQNSEQYPIQFHKSRGLSTVQLKGQKIRILDIDSSYKNDELAKDYISDTEQNSDTKTPSFITLISEASNSKKTIRKIEMPDDSVFLESKGQYLTYINSNNLVSELISFEVDQETTTTIKPTMGQTPQISGLLYYDQESSNENGELDFASGFTISLQKEGYRFFEATSNELGEFSFKKFPLAEYDLIVSNDSDQILYKQTVSVQYGEEIQLEILVKKGVTVQGIVQNINEEPIHDAALTLYGRSTLSEVVNLETRSKLPDGKFIFKELDLTSISDIIISHPDYKTKNVNTSLEESGSITIILENKNGIVVTVNAPDWAKSVGKLYTLRANKQSFGSGIVQNFYTIESSKDVAGEAVHILIPKLDGEYRFALGINDQWDVSDTINWNQKSNSDIPVTLSNNASSELSITWDAVEEEELSSLEVELINSSLPANLFEINPSDYEITKTGVEYNNIPPGEYILTAYLPNGSVETLTGINLSANDSQQFNISVNEEPLEISGFIYYGDNKSNPVSNSKVRFRFSDNPIGEPMIETIADKNGYYTSYPILKGFQYIVEVDINDEKEYKYFDIPPSFSGEVFELDISIPKTEFVLFTITQKLKDIIESMPIRGRLILQSSAQNKSYTVDTNDLSQPMKLVAGKYNIFAAEEMIGEFEVQTSNSEDPQVITLDN